MLVIFIRVIIIYVFLLIAMRLMGKKQLGELQPFEFAVSLLVADLASVPMGDTSVPIAYGLVPVFTLFVLHLIVTKVVKHNLALRGVINGHPILIINKDGIDYKMLKRLDMTINDLLESLRSEGYFSPADVEYAIVETNGSVSIMPKKDSAPLTISDAEHIKNGNMIDKPSLPITLITEGKRRQRNMALAKMSDADVDKILNDNGVKTRDVLLLTISSNSIFLQPKGKKAISIEVGKV